MVLWEPDSGEIQLLMGSNLEDGAIIILQILEGSVWNLGVDWGKNKKEGTKWMKETSLEKSHLDLGKHVGNLERNKANSQADYQRKNIRNYVKVKTKLQSINYYVFTMEILMTVHNVLILVSVIGSLNTSVHKTLTA